MLLKLPSLFNFSNTSSSSGFISNFQTQVIHFQCNNNYLTSLATSKSRENGRINPSSYYLRVNMSLFTAYYGAPISYGPYYTICDDIFRILWLWERHIVLELNLLSDSSSSLSDWSVLRSQDVPTSPASLYGIVSGYYFQGIYVSLYVEERRKDTLVMVIHHFVTLFLVSFSFGMRLWKIGVLVLFCHDLWNWFDLS